MSLRHRIAGIAGLAALLATTGLVVTATSAAAADVADMGALRAAVTTANQTAGDDVITLKSGVTYKIDPNGSQCDGIAGADEDTNLTGDLDVSTQDINGPQDLTIETVTGAPATIEVDCPQSRAFEIIPEVGTPQIKADALNSDLGTFTLDNVIVKNGHAPDTPAAGLPFPGDADGGGILAKDSNVVLVNTTFQNNQAGDGGSAVSEPGAKVVPNVVDSAARGGDGGAVAVLGGTLTISGGTFTTNRAGNGGNGFTNDCSNPDELSGSTSGAPGGDGGALYVVTSMVGADLSVDTSTFSGNSAGSGGSGGDGSPAPCNDSNGGFAGAGSDGGDGGAIAVNNLDTNLSVTHSTFSGNNAGNGGAGGDGFAGASGSGGGAGGRGGFGGNGGGIANLGFVFGQDAVASASRVVSNSTFDSNLAGSGGSGGDGGSDSTGGNGGLGGDGGCGGVGGAVTDIAQDREACGEVRGQAITPNVVDESLALIHDTITENGGGAGGSGGAAGTGDAAGTAGDNGANFGGSIAANDLKAIAIVVGESTDTGPDCIYPTTTPSPIFSASSFATDDSCAFEVDPPTVTVQTFEAFKLTALGDHGGPTQTRVPQAGSILKDTETPSCTVSDDQRGVIRPIGANCDVGAVEVGLPVTLAVTKTPSAASVALGQTVTFTITVKNTGTGKPKPGVTLVETNCSTPESLTGGDANSNGTLDANETWTYTCTAKPPALGTFTNTVTATVADADNLPVTSSATVNVTVVAAAELARTGLNTLRLFRMGLSLMFSGGLFMLRRPDGEHYRRRGRRKTHKGFRSTMRS